MTDAVTSATNTSSAVQSAANDQATAAITSDFETFLKMMTAQLENQDPLNPIESADFAVQLATFSGVEQQVLTNQLLQDLNSQLGQSGMSELAGFIGMEARTAQAPRYQGQPIDLSVTLEDGADSGALIVRDNLNREVQRFDLTPGTAEVRWTGVKDDGSFVPWGDYSFKVESHSGDTVLGTRDAETFALVTEARVDNGTTQLVLATGDTVSAAEVSGLRNPQ